MRWLKFNAVGAIGAALQFALLALLTHVAGMHYLLATAISVEATILHNFVWHRRWTWHDRSGKSFSAIAALARFNLTNGLVSLTANLLSAYLLTGVWRIDPVVASLVSTGVASLANFFLSDRFVFARVVGRSSRHCDAGSAAFRHRRRFKIRRAERRSAPGRGAASPLRASFPRRRGSSSPRSGSPPFGKLRASFSRG